MADFPEPVDITPSASRPPTTASTPSRCPGRNRSKPRRSLASRLMCRATAHILTARSCHDDNRELTKPLLLTPSSPKDHTVHEAQERRRGRRRDQPHEEPASSGRSGWPRSAWPHGGASLDS